MVLSNDVQIGGFERLDVGALCADSTYDRPTLWEVNRVLPAKAARASASISKLGIGKDVTALRKGSRNLAGVRDRAGYGVFQQQRKACAV